MFLLIVLQPADLDRREHRSFFTPLFTSQPDQLADVINQIPVETNGHREYYDKDAHGTQTIKVVGHLLDGRKVGYCCTGRGSYEETDKLCVCLDVFNWSVMTEGCHSAALVMVVTSAFPVPSNTEMETYTFISDRGPLALTHHQRVTGQ